MVVTVSGKVNNCALWFCFISTHFISADKLWHAVNNFSRSLAKANFTLLILLPTGFAASKGFHRLLYTIVSPYSTGMCVPPVCKVIPSTDKICLSWDYNWRPLCSSNLKEQSQRKRQETGEKDKKEIWQRHCFFFCSLRVGFVPAFLRRIGACDGCGY